MVKTKSTKYKETMDKKIITAILFGGFWACWIILLICTNITQIYKLNPQTIFLAAFLGGLVLSVFSFLNPKIYLPFLIIYFVTVGLSLYLHHIHYLIIATVFPIIIAIISIFLKARMFTILSMFFCIIIMLFIFISGYMIIQTRAENKCVFFKNDGHFKPATLTNYTKMLYPIIFQSYIPSGALLILSDAQYPDKRWVLSPKGNLIEIHNFSATLSGETQCKSK